MRIEGAGARRGFATRLWSIFERLAEEETRYESFSLAGEPVFIPRRAVRRAALGFPLSPSYAFAGREREAVVLILDDSGSMSWWARELSELAGLAMARGDVEIFLAPNGLIQRKWERGGWVDVEEREVMPQLRGRVVVYVGDYDGARLPVELSGIAEKVVWICPENRYLEPGEHDWASPYIRRRSEFRGVFIRALDLEEAVRLLEAVHPFTRRAVVDPHEDELQERGGVDE